jgi:hypothetical protein
VTLDFVSVVASTITSAVLDPTGGWLSLIPDDAGYVGMLVLGAGPFVVAMLLGRLVTRSASEVRIAEAVRSGDARVADAVRREGEWRDLAGKNGERADRLADSLGGSTELARSVEKLIVAVTDTADDGGSEVTHAAR